MSDDALRRVRTALATLLSVIVQNENENDEPPVLVVCSDARPERLVRIRATASDKIRVDLEDVSYARSDWIDHVVRLDVDINVAPRIVQIWLTGGDVEDCIALA